MTGWLPEPTRWLASGERGDHTLLAPGFQCLYLGELRGDQDRSGLDALIAHYKRSPLDIEVSSGRGRARAGKERAIAAVAGRLRRTFGAAAVACTLTFVPIPSSKRPGHPQYCDRLVRTLRLAFRGLGADVRPLLRQRVSTRADHASRERLSYERLLAITEIDPAHAARPLRALAVLFDDVLTSGKHLRVASERIRERWPAQEVIAVIVARRALRAPPAPSVRALRA